jgi:hypothetical protein
VPKRARVGPVRRVLGSRPGCPLVTPSVPTIGYATGTADLLIVGTDSPAVSVRMRPSPVPPARILCPPAPSSSVAVRRVRLPGWLPSRSWGRCALFVPPSWLSATRDGAADWPRLRDRSLLTSGRRCEPLGMVDLVLDEFAPACAQHVPPRLLAVGSLQALAPQCVVDAASGLVLALGLNGEEDPHMEIRAHPRRVGVMRREGTRRLVLPVAAEAHGHGASRSATVALRGHRQDRLMCKHSAHAKSVAATPLVLGTAHAIELGAYALRARSSALVATSGSRRPARGQPLGAARSYWFMATRGHLGGTGSRSDP